MTATMTRLGFTTDAKPFTAAVAWAARRLPPRPTNPVLAGMLLTVADGRLTVSAFDYETSASATIDVENATDGAVLVSGRLLHGLASTLDGKKPLKVSDDGTQVTVDYGGVLTLPTMPVEDYPQLPELPETVGTVDAVAFARLVDRVAVCASTDAVLPVLLCVAVRLGSDGLVALASDRYRGAIDRIQFDGYDGPDAELLVPADVLKAAAPMLAEAGGRLTLSAGGGLFGISADSRSLIACTVAAEFPKVDRLMPPRTDAPVLLPAADILAAVKRAGLTLDKAGPVILAFTPGRVSVGSAGDNGKLREPVPLDYDGPDVELKANPGYLTDALHAAGGAKVELSFNADAKKPFLITAIDDGTFRYFAMPIRIAN